MSEKLHACIQTSALVLTEQYPRQQLAAHNGSLEPHAIVHLSQLQGRLQLVAVLTGLPPRTNGSWAVYTGFRCAGHGRPDKRGRPYPLDVGVPFARDDIWRDATWSTDGRGNALVEWGTRALSLNEVPRAESRCVHRAGSTPHHVHVHGQAPTCRASRRSAPPVPQVAGRTLVVALADGSRVACGPIQTTTSPVAWLSPADGSPRELGSIAPFSGSIGGLLVASQAFAGVIMRGTLVGLEPAAAPPRWRIGPRQSLGGRCTLEGNLPVVTQTTQLDIGVDGTAQVPAQHILQPVSIPAVGARMACGGSYGVRGIVWHARECMACGTFTPCRAHAINMKSK